MEYNSSEADIATKDFFSKFCFYIKAVNQDPSKLDQALERLNNFLEKTHITNGVTNGDAHLQVGKIFSENLTFLYKKQTNTHTHASFNTDIINYLHNFYHRKFALLLTQVPLHI